MAKRDTSDSESEEGSSSSASDSETMANAKGVSEYEKQRMSRIAENRARLEALGLPQIASSLKGSPQTNQKGKEKVQNDDDEEYVPEDDGEFASGFSSEEDDNHKDEDFAVENASGSRKRKVKNKGLKTKGRVSGKKHVNNSENIDDDDEALRQAIALSLQDSKNVVNISKTEKKGSNHIQEDKGRKKNKKPFSSRLQMTEDELIVHFFQLDEAGKGTITIRDLQRAATAHDFLWTDKELVDMIRCFDSDGDGKLSLDDFRKIVVRCNLIKD
ncbi:protein IWS1 homolog A-like isoform X2 [Abrus precatorius]|uniref:Protein IWS1 homolog A-like isoform X2 n=1 Tax=Abrus precatorius TaxID=3816 RepID=A0A8B8K140_ABRPR|nr:protein IWS1 homolog A-like isoform X2 [Abrus precatorius]